MHRPSEALSWIYLSCASQKKERKEKERRERQEGGLDSWVKEGGGVWTVERFVDTDTDGIVYTSGPDLTSSV